MKTQPTRPERPSMFPLCAIAVVLVFSFRQGVTAQTNTFPSSGNVGIGTTSPAAKLEVSGANPVQRITITDATQFGGLILHENSTQKFNFTFAGSASGATYVGGANAGHIWNHANGPIVFGTNAAERLRIDASGKVGIGTTNPLYSLDVNGGVNAFRSKAGTASSDDTIATFENSNGIQAIVRANGNIGIGTVNPLKKLHLLGSNSQILLDRTANTAGNYSLITFGTNGTAKYFFGLNSDSDPNADRLSFFDSSFSAAAPVMTLTGGNVGVGTTAPVAKLHVVGNGKVTGNLEVTGNIAAKYQDVAEWVESSQSLPAGTVVVLDHTKSNQVIASSQAYDTRVAGVISAQPGLTLGEKGENKVLVATTGRVRIKVDASRGSIQIGDLLVTSEREGVAMKSQAINLGGVQIHRPGTLIGKALEPLANGQGEILVLLSLQ